MADNGAQQYQQGYGYNPQHYAQAQYMQPPYGQQGLSPAHAEQLRAFWQEQLKEIHHVPCDPAEFKNHQLPLARIKKIMKSDEDVRMISAEAPVLFAKACEMFILELTLRSWYHAEENKRRTLQRNDIAAAITSTDIFDFLIDIVPREDLKTDGHDATAAAAGAAPQPAAGAAAMAGPSGAATAQQPNITSGMATGMYGYPYGMGHPGSGPAGMSMDPAAAAQMMQAYSQQYMQMAAGQGWPNTAGGAGAGAGPPNMVGMNPMGAAPVSGYGQQPNASGGSVPTNTAGAPE